MANPGFPRGGANPKGAPTYYLTIFSLAPLDPPMQHIDFFLELIDTGAWDVFLILPCIFFNYLVCETCFNDKTSYVYNDVLQTIYELLRYISHVPTLIPHATMDNTTLGGYTLPEGTQVYSHYKFYVCLEKG